MKAANSWSSTTRNFFFLLLMINKHSKEKLGLPGFKTTSAILNYDGKRAKAHPAVRSTPIYLCVGMTRAGYECSGARIPGR